MRKNLEIKASIENIESCEKIAKSIHARFDRVMKQTDTYFNVSHGRLKLREIDDVQAELIYYSRNEEGNHRISDFQICPVQNPSHLREILALSLGIKIQVVKKRILYMYQTTRIHLDNIDNLGSFLEFEVPVDKNEQNAQETLDFLVSLFGIKENEYIKESYSDLLLRKK